MVLAEVGCGEVRGLGYSYADPTAAGIIEAHLAGIVQGSRVVDIPRLWWRMVSALRNIGRPGIGMTAVSAMDIALWDLKARACWDSRSATCSVACATRSRCTAAAASRP